jgi:integrase/recombinase XerD
MEVFKVVNQYESQFFGLKVDKNSQEMQIVKGLNQRYWNQELKLWLIPYGKVQWQQLISNFDRQNICINKEVLNFTYQKQHLNNNKKPNNGLEKVPKLKIDLSENHKQALLLMKEQLILNRYTYNTQKNYLSNFTEFLCHYQNEAVDSLTKDHIRDFLLYKIKTDNISESTQNSLINAIKFYYEKVEKRERFVIYDLRPRNAHKLPGFLSKEEVTKLIKVIENDKHRLIIKLIYSAGLRLGELTRLKKSDLRWDTNQILIKCSKGKKDRLATLSDKLKTEIMAYLEKYRPNYYLIEGQDGGIYSPRSVQHIFQAALVKSKIETHATVHTLRHSYATHMILNGVDIRCVQDLLGHNSIKTTEIYTHITDSIKKELKSPLDDLDL